MGAHTIIAIFAFVAIDLTASARGQGADEFSRFSAPSGYRPVTGAAPAPAGPAGASERLRRGAYQSVQVNVDADGNNIVGDAANQPSIAVDPRDHTHLLIGWRQFDSVLSDFREAGWAYSHDTGRTWTFAGVIQEGVQRSNPVVSSDSAGNFYYYSMTDNYTCQLFKSTDGGLSWSGPVAAFGGDAGWMEIDRTGGYWDGNIYAASRAGTATQIEVTRSCDDGASFIDSTPVAQNPGRGTFIVGPLSRVYLGGWSWTTSDHPFICGRSTNWCNPAYTPSFHIMRQVDLGGQYVSNRGPNPAGLLGLVTVGAWRPPGSSEDVDDVYLLCSVDPPGDDPLDVNFAYSRDNGMTWSAPQKINDDPGGHDAWQWFGTMSVAPNGRIDVVWNDTRNSLVENWSELYYSYSVDRGLHWSPNEPLTPAWDSSAGWPQQNKIGDHYHMRSDNVGADLAYAATFNGEQDVYYLRIGDYDCNGNGIGDLEDLSAGTSYDYNHNGIPDECEGLIYSLGDLNCDFHVNAFDIDPFVLALTSPYGYAAQFPHCDYMLADCNGDGFVNAFDIDPFVRVLTGGGYPL